MSVSLSPMEGSRLIEWLSRSRTEYIRSRHDAGETLEQAEANAEKSFTTYFTEGRPAAGQHVYTVHTDDGRDVGELWIGVVDEPSNAWWVFDVEIAEAERGNGYGRAAMLLAEEESARLGAASSDSTSSASTRSRADSTSRSATRRRRSR
ncbi:hypothetical protein GCM10025867_17500 [Frondihabitans sucicola]|uniref:N-acetyltransferase domain-containing protein n=1 Tax=Frondihabitans sucicola TaxID=1268041 RepID=A0ABN6XXA8_9MICO|nr:GNAT family N-acetyltransferase [Frondihabitans sucicola]BDZ49509.1 hypothetical protein GCM10025867_17500 [Frondihabitans sucicola]